MSLFGRLYRVFTFGQSHSSHVGCVVEGFPSNFKVNLQQIQQQLDRRRPGQSNITTSRVQKDQVSCISGLQNQISLGSPLCFIVRNQNVKKGDYSNLSNVPRPGHADFTYLKKYGLKAQSGGGRSSARQTIGRVIAGSLAKQFLLTKGIQFSSYVRQISHVSIPRHINQAFIQQQISNQQIEKLGKLVELKNGQIYSQIQKNKYKIFKDEQVMQVYSQKELFKQNQIKQIVNLRCPYFQSAVHMLREINKIKQKSDSLGGIVQGCIYGLPIGLGEPCFDKLPALLSHAMLSIPATKGFEYGSGFDCAEMTGSFHNDRFDSNLRLQSNNCGGTLGGISSGSTFYYNVAFKPASSIEYPQKTHSFDGKPVNLVTKGRHDPCVLPRAPPIVDNMAAMVIMDLWLIQNAQNK